MCVLIQEFKTYQFMTVDIGHHYTNRFMGWIWMKVVWFFIIWNNRFRFFIGIFSMGIFHGIQSTIHIQQIVHSVLSVLLCLRMGRMGPDFMAIVMVRMMHGVMGIRFFWDTDDNSRWRLRFLCRWKGKAGCNFLWMKEIRSTSWYPLVS